MSGLFSKPDVVKPPKPKPAPPVPTVGPEVGEQAKKKRPRGRLETFLTGDLVPVSSKRTRLG